MLSAARTEARSKFDSNRLLDSQSPEVSKKIAEVEEIARILRQNLVQGERLKGSGDDEQRYRALLSPYLSWSSMRAGGFQFTLWIDQADIGAVQSFESMRRSKEETMSRSRKETS